MIERISWSGQLWGSRSYSQCTFHSITGIRRSMNAAVVVEPIKEASPRFKARMAGLFEVLEALTSGFGQVIVPAMLTVSGDAATVANLLSHELLIRLSLAAALVAAACHIIWTFLFYELFKP